MSALCLTPETIRKLFTEKHVSKATVAEMRESCEISGRSRRNELRAVLFSLGERPHAHSCEICPRSHRNQASLPLWSSNNEVFCVHCPKLRDLYEISQESTVCATWAGFTSFTGFTGFTGFTDFTGFTGFTGFTCFTKLTPLPALPASSGTEP